MVRRTLESSCIYCKIFRVLSDHLGRYTLKGSQPKFTCSKLTIETLEQGVKYVQS